MRFEEGQKVIWLKPKNGMLGVKRLPAIVRGYTKSRIAIEAVVDGKTVLRYVEPENLLGEKECV